MTGTVIGTKCFNSIGETLEITDERKGGEYLVLNHTTFAEMWMTRAQLMRIDPDLDLPAPKTARADELIADGRDIVYLGDAADEEEAEERWGDLSDDADDEETGSLDVLIYGRRF